ncbi:MAG: RdgB/HAM1 family non-canonical purine NTP pyrophosphatase [Clostridia bacterium]|nr:RdgB/HAM1 family non-canonical purine NTP pyrophosphatase [Clostridia bacterium]
MKKIIIASNNEKKLCELEAILGSAGMELINLAQAGISSQPEETGATFEENALIKARAACAEGGLPAVADDSGLEVYALDGAPGVYSARYGGGSDSDRVSLLLENMRGVPEDERGGRFVSVMACVLPDGTEFCVRGECEGRILAERRGTGGFGYDPVFFVEEYGQTFAEMPAELKNRISHRARAIAALHEEMKKRGIL